jgi:hypothetical protein
MESTLITLAITIIGGTFVLIVEYFVIGLVGATARKRIGVALLFTFSLFIPLVILQLGSALFVAVILGQLPQPVRVDLFANLYAVLAMLWGWFWGTKLRPWLRNIFEPEG